MIFVSVYPNSVRPRPENAEYTRAFADGTPIEVIATDLFNHGESNKAVGITAPADIHANLVTAVNVALNRAPGFAVSINTKRQLVADVR